jgi:serine/threonine protein kinase
MTPSRPGDQAPTLPHVSAPGAAGTPPELADHPRYRLAEVLGEGGMGTVYRAEHRLMKRWVALKVVRHALLEQPAVRERFLGELRATAQLTHPNIVVAHDAEQVGNVCFLAMEYVPGEDLATLLRRRGPLPAAEACEYVRQAALGLQHAHECGLVHRDIKPHNLMITADGRVKILDFGLARLALEQAAAERPAPTPPPLPGDGTTVSVAGPHTVTGSVLGTPAYMAPEQARDPRCADIRSDVYSLGRTLVHLLAGRLPFGQTTEMPPGLPPGLAGVLCRMLAAVPNERYQTPAEVAAALAPFAQGPGTSRPGRRRLILGAAAAFLCVCGVAVGLAFYFRSAPRHPDSKPTPPGQATGSPVYDDPRAPTYVSLVASPNPTLEGTESVLTATVRPVPNNVGTPEGKVTFLSGDDRLGEAPLTDGRATLTIKAPATGRRSLTAVYIGDDTYAGSTSPAVAFRVGIGAVHRITVLAQKPGAFTVGFNGNMSAPIQTGARAEQVAAALNALATVHGVDGSVTVVRESNSYTVTFIGSLGAKKVPLLTAVGGGGVGVTVVELRRGGLP